MDFLKQACRLYVSRGSVVIFFVLTIAYLVMSPLFSYYWLRENNGPALTPDVDYRARWISDADFRGLDRTDKPEYTSEDGRSTYAAGETWQIFRPYYISSPDGKWHLEVLARGPMTPYSLRAYVGAAIPALVFSIMGLAICLYGRTADITSKAKGPDRPSHDLE
jgi:hypothetical protein